MSLLRFTIKSTIVGGIVYYTYEEGLWSNGEETAKLYKKIYVNVAPYVKENIPKEVTQELSELPSVIHISTFMKTSWNKGVINTMEFISNLPTHTTNGAIKLYETVGKYVKDLSQ
ncbi:PREDICTED: MICOS complex subunit MIC13-like [Habropoda laboriosa]|uniref:MICOS complex subunit MIC13-like n=1 Tax=Habropoda laboriosa TaxID=597456 RepID=UPI00083CACA8|nr:PREDICTED: MICOS complex subunit MIC13-like [Habropoda laboriosa]